MSEHDALADLQRLIALAAAVTLAPHIKAGSVTQAMEAHSTHYAAINERLKDPDYRSAYQAAVAKLMPHYGPKPVAS